MTNKITPDNGLFFVILKSFFNLINIIVTIYRMVQLKITIVFTLIFLSNSLKAQQYLGIVGSNYAGTNSLYANPANRVGSRHKVFVNLAAADLFVGNNAVKWNADYTFLRLLRGAVDKTLPKVPWGPNSLETIDNNNKKNLNG